MEWGAEIRWNQVSAWRGIRNPHHSVAIGHSDDIEKQCSAANIVTLKSELEPELATINPDLLSLMKGRWKVILYVGLGGTFGTYAAMEVARHAHVLGIPVDAYVTTPFNFEGKKRCEKSKASINSLRNIDAKIIEFSNESLMLGDFENMEEAYEQQCKVIVEATHISCAHSEPKTLH